MKKIIAMLLCVALVAALGVSAFAADPGASDVIPATTNPDDLGAALFDAGASRFNTNMSKDAATIASALGDLKKLDDAYVAYATNPANSGSDVAKAYTKYQNDVAKLVASWGSKKMADGVTTLNNASVNLGSITVNMSDFDATYDITAAPAKTAADGKTDAGKVEAGRKLLAAGFEHAVTWDLSDGTVMDENKLAISNAKTDAAADKEAAVKDAVKAKEKAVKAQSTAKALIADAITVAQDSAAMAVAKAQKDAYDDLAKAYATAVADFWADVSAAIAGF